MQPAGRRGRDLCRPVSLRMDRAARVGSRGAGGVVPASGSGRPFVRERADEW